MHNSVNIRDLNGVEASISQFPLIGYTVFWRLAGIRVSHPDLERVLQATGFDKYLPDPPTPRVALRRALAEWIRAKQRIARSLQSQRDDEDQEENDGGRRRTLIRVIRYSLFEYFSRTPIEEIDPLAPSQFYHDYPAQASKLPCFVAARRKRYESGDDVSKMTTLSAPQVLSYENPPLLLADKARVIREDGTVDSVEYGLHTFLELSCGHQSARSRPDHRMRVGGVYSCLNATTGSILAARLAGR